MQFLITALLLAAWLLWLWAATRSPENVMIGETLRDIFHFLKEWRQMAERHHQEQTANQRIIVSALSDLTDAVNNAATTIPAAAHDLTLAIDKAVSTLGSPGATDAQLATLTTTVNSLQSTLVAQLQAQTQRLNDATSPVTPPPPPPAPAPALTP